MMGLRSAVYRNCGILRRHLLVLPAPGRASFCDLCNLELVAMALHQVGEALVRRETLPLELNSPVAEKLPRTGLARAAYRARLARLPVVAEPTHMAVVCAAWQRIGQGDCAVLLTPKG